MIHSTTHKVFNCRDLSANAANELEINGFKIKLYHSGNDPDTANRVRVSTNLVELELLPSKGLSLCQAWIKGQIFFWEAPIGLPDTETLDLWSDEIKINGNPAPGFTFLKTLVAGVEMYGLRNWGMPVINFGQLHPIHGEASNIPVNEVKFTIENEKTCNIESSFIYRTFEGDNNLPWYKRGRAICKVIRKMSLTKNEMEFSTEDTIVNISETEQTPDWGYHIIFRPEEGATLKVPSKRFHERNFNALPTDIETWHNATDVKVRTETGIVHKELLANNGVTSLITYPNQTCIAVTVPPSPYFQTWFCTGGKGSREFTFKNGESLLKKNWDGLGIEIGSSPLDHNGNVDESVIYDRVLKPGEKKTIQMRFQCLEQIQLDRLTNEINAYNRSRKFEPQR